MTPAEELLAAVKKHATADVDFTFTPHHSNLHVGGNADAYVFFSASKKLWMEDVPRRGLFTHDSASSAVYSAFLRARK